MKQLKNNLEKFRTFDKTFGEKGAEQITEIIDIGMSEIKESIHRLELINEATNKSIENLKWLIIAASTVITTVLLIITTVLLIKGH